MGTISQMAKAIVPYIKGLVKSRHDETTHGDTTYPMFQNVNPHRVWGCAYAP
jgi:hypothetical protein